MDTLEHIPGPPPRLRCESRLPAAAAEAFAWHERPGAFERLVPPWQRVEVLERPRDLRDGSRATLRVHLGPLVRTWVAEHRDHVPGRRFRDVQVRGPFRRWEHTHEVRPAGEEASVLVDDVVYDLPLGPLGRLLGGRFLRRDLERLFAYRHRTMVQDLGLHARTPRPLRIAVTGGRGLVGAQLCAFLGTGGHEVVRMVRGSAGDAEGGQAVAPWTPGGPLAESEGRFDAVVHLAGAPVGRGRWREARRRDVLRSHREGTAGIADGLLRMREPPSVFVCASGADVYGDRGDERLTEASAEGAGFLAELRRAREQACEPAARAGVRVVHARLGTVLSARGGVLPRLVTPCRLGLGGSIGAGRQWTSWISLDDAVGAILHAIVDASVQGPVNVTSPAPVTNRELALTLARVLRRPARVRWPAPLARLRLGPADAEPLLASRRVLPAALERTGYAFVQPDLEGALRRELGRVAARSGPQPFR